MTQWPFLSGLVCHFCSLAAERCSRVRRRGWCFLPAAAAADSGHSEESSRASAVKPLAALVHACWQDMSFVLGLASMLLAVRIHMRSIATSKRVVFHQLRISF